MKKINFSLVEKKLIRLVILFVLVQILIVFILAHLLISGRQIGVNDTKQVDISVEDVRCVRAFGENCLFIVSDSTEYLFKSRSTPNEYSVSELLESISKGDKLFLISLLTQA